MLLGTARSSGLPASHGVFEEACPERQGTDSKDAEGGPALSGLWSTIPPLKNQLQLLMLPAPAPLAAPPASAPPAPLQHQDHSHPSYYSTKSGGKVRAPVGTSGGRMPLTQVLGAWDEVGGVSEFQIETPKAQNTERLPRRSELGM